MNTDCLPTDPKPGNSGTELAMGNSQVIESSRLRTDEDLPPEQEVARSNRAGRTTSPTENKLLTPLTGARDGVARTPAPGRKTDNSGFVLAPEPPAVTIKLTQGYVALIDPEDYERVAVRRWRAKVDERYGLVYAICHVPGTGRHGKCERLHRFILGVKPGQIVDHINGDGLDNRKANLRICTNAQNIRNQRPHATRKTISKFKGVTRCNGRGYRAQIMVNYRKINLGTYTTPEAAASAYDAAARQHHGAFARPNFPEATP